MMFFRVISEVIDLYLQFPESGILQLSFLVPERMELEFRYPREGEKFLGLSKTEILSGLNIICKAQLSRDPPNNVIETFKELENWPPIDLSKDYDDNGNIVIDLFDDSSYDSLPESFKEFNENVIGQLVSNLGRILRMLRWRYALPGPPSPFSVILFEWSLDGKKWIEVPDANNGGIYKKMASQIPLTAPSVIGSLLNDGIDEPTGHELLREAYNLKNENPRSALVIGMAAAEVALKEMISRLIPDTQWLVENLPSPPIDKILKNYLPILPIKNKILGKVLPPPKPIMVLIKEGMERRNKIVHVGKPTVNIDFLDKLFPAIEDLLWLLDYYSGFDWAMDHIRPETKTKLE